MEYISSVKLNEAGDKLVILDQTLLPRETVYIELDAIEDVWEAIKKLRVRGAPAIGIAAAYGLYLGIKNIKTESFEDFYKIFKEKLDYLASSRPTAVNLFWALKRMDERANKEKHKRIDEIKKALLDEAEKIRGEDEEVCYKIGEHGLSLLKRGMGLLTHCNAGAIATARYGTALSPMYLGQERGYDFKVYADETRPLLQGARLTAWELIQAGIDVTLICDNMASIVMSEKKIDAVLVGCDRVAANGDTANKIGTSGVAILAKEYSIPFYVCAPMSTIDLSTKTGDDIVIEQRNADEVTAFWGQSHAPDGIKVYNPAFDVTKAKYITAIITEKGVVYPPYGENLVKLFE
ncbi:S-methyl-5-thioribose-1-phosphate isomerase [Oxobacter pfennigii]|uniref:S-methyl-5-thioribose-1-phosphate isomerase n=1 Tax=Oxobacter pfennigii TaxID=36849 RepID=UPI00128EC331|nr:S-methyl-5-thioribose-1-phosphate isomerase [Oxobacter pfennigii]